MLHTPKLRAPLVQERWLRAGTVLRLLRMVTYVILTMDSVRRSREKQAGTQLQSERREGKSGSTSGDTELFSCRVKAPGWGDLQRLGVGGKVGPGKRSPGQRQLELKVLDNGPNVTGFKACKKQLTSVEGRPSFCQISSGPGLNPGRENSPLTTLLSKVPQIC